jgi:hypothetical protein
MKSFVVVMAALLLVSCQQAPSSHLIVFMENEQGIEPYQTRVISSVDYLRFDDGEGSEDYVLYNRKEQKIYSINAAQKTTMVVEKKQHDLKPPMELNHTVKDMGVMDNAPTVNDKAPRHFQYYTNGKLCLDVVSLAGLMDDALAGMREFHSVLATDSATTFGTLPADMHDPCDISFSTFAPVRHLQNGFPIQEWKTGYSRSLVNYQLDYKADPKLFMLPGDYFTYSVQQLREGRVDFANREIITEPVSETEPKSTTQ